MGLPIGSLESTGRDVRVDLGRRQVLVAQQLLDHSQVGAAVEQVRGEGMPQRMRGDADREPGANAQPVEAVAQAAHTERTAEMVQEDLGRRRIRRSAAFEEDRAAVLEVVLERLPCRAAKQPDPFLASLAEDPDLSTPQVESA